MAKLCVAENQQDWCPEPAPGARAAL